jgi:2-dehydropantoate 2-reductase
VTLLVRRDPGPIRVGAHGRPRFTLPLATRRAAAPTDVLVLCVPSTALDPRWLADLAAATGDATVVTLQPGLLDHERIVAAFGAERVVAGMFPLLAWSDEDGTTYWKPPFASLPLAGPRAAAVAPLFVAGGLPARVVAGVRDKLAAGGALLDTHVAALARAGWSLAPAAVRSRAPRPRPPRFARIAPDRRPPPRAAGRRAAPAPAGRAGAGGRPAPGAIRSRTILEQHYTKVAAQTRALLAATVERGDALGLPTAALAALAQP